MEQQNARIVATALHAPDRVVPNAWFDAHLGEDVSTWLEENLTIRERRWCADDESTADLVTACAGFVTALDMGASDFNRYCYAVAENVEAMLDAYKRAFVRQEPNAALQATGAKHTDARRPRAVRSRPLT